MAASYVGPDPTKPPKWRPYPDDGPHNVSCRCQEKAMPRGMAPLVVFGIWMRHAGSIAVGYCDRCGQVYLASPSVEVVLVDGDWVPIAR